MNPQLVQQLFSAIDQAPVSDIKQWKQALSEASSKLDTRTKVVIEAQQKLLNDLVGAPAQSDTPKARLVQETVVLAIDAILSTKTQTSIDEVDQWLRINSGFIGTRSRVIHHLNNLTEAGVLVVKKDEEMKTPFKKNLYLRNPEIG